MSSKKILIIRLSSFGDIIQVLPCVDQLHSEGYSIDFITKLEFKHCIEAHPHINNKIYFDKKNNMFNEYKKFSRRLSSEEYDFIYDAHNNLRSLIFRILSSAKRTVHKLFKKKSIWVKRPKSRFKRFLFFKLKKRNLFPKPYISAQSFIDPLIKKNILKTSDLKLNKLNEIYNKNIHKASIYPVNSNYIVLAPSAAWPLKRWPLSYFQNLIDQKPDLQFLIIGGPSDFFTYELQGRNSMNLVGKIGWADTGKIILNSKLIISGDTGVLHWADYMQVPAVGLLGPTAFGYPFRPTSKILNKELKCSPCSKDGRGQCKIKETQKCLKDIQPHEVLKIINEITNL